MHWCIVRTLVSVALMSAKGQEAGQKTQLYNRVSAQIRSEYWSTGGANGTAGRAALKLQKKKT